MSERGIFHGDIKPNNIVCGSNNEKAGFIDFDVFMPTEYMISSNHISWSVHTCNKCYTSPFDILWHNNSIEKLSIQHYKKFIFICMQYALAMTTIANFLMKYQTTHQILTNLTWIHRSYISRSKNKSKQNHNINLTDFLQYTLQLAKDQKSSLRVDDYRALIICIYVIQNISTAYWKLFAPQNNNTDFANLLKNTLNDLHIQITKKLDIL